MVEGKILVETGSRGFYHYIACPVPSQSNDMKGRHGRPRRQSPDDIIIITPWCPCLQNDLTCRCSMYWLRWRSNLSIWPPHETTQSSTVPSRSNDLTCNVVSHGTLVRPSRNGGCAWQPHQFIGEGVVRDDHDDLVNRKGWDKLPFFGWANGAGGIIQAVCLTKIGHVHFSFFLWK